MKWMTLKEVLGELQVARSTFDDWRVKGEAPPVRKLPNGTLRIKRTDLEMWMDERLERAS